MKHRRMVQWNWLISRLKNTLPIPSLRILLVGGIACLVVAGVYLLPRYIAPEELLLPEETYLNSVSWDIETYKDYFSSLAREKGAEYAYLLLRKVSIAEGIDTHELAHEIGYVFYAEKGVSGIFDCTDDFQSGCTHAIVIQEFIHNSQAALRSLVKICSEGESESSSSICFHGIGHGLLAYLRYDFKKAIEQCGVVHDILLEQNMSEHSVEMWSECVGGATMELTRGTHDKDAWKHAKTVYMPDDDILMPCDAPYVSKETRPMCYLYILPRFFIAAGRTSEERIPSPQLYPKAFSYCALISPEDQDSRKACYGGFGVDFVYFANGNDSRGLGHLPDSALDNVHTWCALAPNFNATSACTLTAVGVLSGGEENDAPASLRFCERTPDVELQERCFNTLVSIANTTFGPEKLDRFCKTVPKKYQALCKMSG